MYAAAGGASLAGRKARQHGRQGQPPSPPASPSHGPHVAPGVRAFSCQHWEARLLAPPTRPQSAPRSGLHSPCDPHECAAGRAAWQEAAAISVGGGGAAGGAARRCSVLGDHPGARRDARAKWLRNNRIRDASYGSSSDSEGEPEGITGEPWGVAKLLYAGLGVLALGLVVYFVGTGDKGFKTPALRLVGPSLIVAGLACCLLRIAFCIFAKPCCRRRNNYKENRRLDGIGIGEALPLARARTGPAQCSPARRLDASSCDVSSLSSGEEDERLRRYRTASLPLPGQRSAPPCLQQSAVQIANHQKQEEMARSPSPGQMPGQTQTLPSSSEQQILPSHSGQTLGQTSTLGHTSTLGQTPESPDLLVLPGQGIMSVPGTSHGRRPPPRNVSFAGAPDGELVLSPAQLRS